MKIFTNQSTEVPMVACGMRKLCAAVLHSALVDLFSPSACRVYEPKKESTPRQTSWQQRAADWIASDEYAEDSFTYRYVCEVLNMDPVLLREGIAKMSSANLRGTRIQAIAHGGRAQ